MHVWVLKDSDIISRFLKFLRKNWTGLPTVRKSISQPREIWLAEMSKHSLQMECQNIPYKVTVR